MSQITGRGVENGGADQKPVALAMLGGNLGQEFFGHIEGDDPGEGRVATERPKSDPATAGRRAEIRRHGQYAFL
jgi:hypothetical protein